MDRPDPPRNAQANGQLKHGAWISQVRQRQRAPAAGGDRRQLEQPVPWDVPCQPWGLPRAYRAWPLAWPPPSGPAGRQRSPALKGGSWRSFLRSG